jgi:hypothetical protein
MASLRMESPAVFAFWNESENSRRQIDNGDADEGLQTLPLHQERWKALPRAGYETADILLLSLGERSTRETHGEVQAEGSTRVQSGRAQECGEGDGNQGFNV